MKLVKMSLAAAMLMSASAYAEVKNVKFEGQAKLIYQTADWELTPAEEALDLTSELFNKGDFIGAGASYGGTAGGGALTMGITGEVNEGVQFGYEAQAVSSLGLENNLVNNVMYRSTQLDAWNTTQAYLAKTMGNTTVKVGRQELNTPLLFTEKWNLAKNTFEALAVVNNDIENTTLIGAWAGRHNGAGAGFTAQLDNGVDSGSSPFYTVGNEGAYTLGVVNTSLDATTLQAWYYDVIQVTNAIWLQADTKALEVVSIGAQFSTMDPSADGFDAATIYALKVAGEIEGFNLYGAFSAADEDGFRNFSNLSTGDKTKIYTGTGSIYMDGIMTNPGTTAYKLGASTKLSDVKLHASFAQATNMFDVDDNDVYAWDAKASTKVAGIGLTAIYTSVINKTKAAGNNVYAGRNNDTIRFIASMKF